MTLLAGLLLKHSWIQSLKGKGKWAKDDDDTTSERTRMTEKEREMFPAFGGEPHDSEFKRRTSVGSDDWELDSYVRQLENPKVMTQTHGIKGKDLNGDT